MLAHGARKLVGAAAARITAQQMDAHALPLADRSHDAIFCAFGVRNLSDLPAATREQHRVLRPGGRLTVLEFFRPTSFATRAVHALHNRTILPLLGWAATGNLGAYLYLPRSIGRFATVEAYSELLRASGFIDIEIRRLTLGIAWVVRATRAEST
jgi:demethylmenaquinone methyltransferase/2-methoxy-6-polyprenyl-1,4-benzoquinol methylase